MDNCYTYTHTRLDTNEVFYVGIGTNSKTYKKEFGRAHSGRARSSFWQHVVKKTEYRVDVLETGLSRETACKREIELIALYGRRDQGLGPLVNMTVGGDGVSGHIFSEEHKQKISLAHKGKVFSESTRGKMSQSAKRKIITEEHKKNISKSLMGNTYSLGFKHSEETRKKVGEAGKGRRPMLGKHHTEESKKQTSEKLMGRFMSEEHRKKIGDALRGRVGATKGRKYGPMSEERKRNISLAKRKKAVNV